MFDPDRIKEIKKEQSAWQEKIEARLSKSPERKNLFTTLSEIPLERVYTPADVADLDYLRYGLLFARKAWLEPGQVLNTLSVEEADAWFTSRRKKTRR